MFKRRETRKTLHLAALKRFKQLKPSLITQSKLRCFCRDMKNIHPHCNVLLSDFISVQKSFPFVNLFRAEAVLYNKLLQSTLLYCLIFKNIGL